MTISYRARVVLVAAGVVAAALSATLALTWADIRSVEGERLDARLCLEARRLASQPFSEDGFRRLDRDVMAKLRLSDRSQLLLRIEQPGMPPAHSIDWPPGLALDSLEWAQVGERNGESVPSPAPPNPTVQGGASPEGAPIAAPRSPGPVGCAVAKFDLGKSSWRAALVAGPTARGFVAADADAAAGELLAVMKGTLSQVIPIALVLSLFGGLLLSALAIRPLNRLREAMKAVSRKDLSQRLSPSGEDREFQELIGAYNTMLARLQASFEQASRFSADAAHELRTPLTILQGRLEQAIRKPELHGIHADLADMMEELQRLAAITRKLLLLSQADAGQLALNPTGVDLTALLDALVADARMLVANPHQVTSDVEPGLIVRADRLLLQQLLNNLISNAVRYCRPGGTIEVTGHRGAKAFEVTIANACDPIPAADRTRLFDRFYRLDPTRNRRSEGTGLGLSLAREIARAHGGDLTLEPSAPDTVRVRLELPLG